MSLLCTSASCKACVTYWHLYSLFIKRINELLFEKEALKTTKLVMFSPFEKPDRAAVLIF